MNLKLTFHEGVEPECPVMIPTVYLDESVRKGFNDRDCGNIFLSLNNPFLYGQNREGTWYRCDTQYHK